jgi:hypothetical protein
MANGLPRSTLVLAIVASASLLPAQTTDGIVSGRLRNSIGSPVVGGYFVCENAQMNTRVSALTGDLGTFGLPALPPGRYRIRTDAGGYLSADVENLLPPVAGVLGAGPGSAVDAGRAAPGIIFESSRGSEAAFLGTLKIPVKP